MSWAEAVARPLIHYRDGLRGWLGEVQNIGELLHVNGAHWDVEMGSITQMLAESSDNSAPAILFDEIPGYPKGFRLTSVAWVVIRHRYSIIAAKR